MDGWDGWTGDGRGEVKLNVCGQVEQQQQQVTKYIIAAGLIACASSVEEEGGKIPPAAEQSRIKYLSSEIQRRRRASCLTGPSARKQTLNRKGRGGEKLRLAGKTSCCSCRRRKFPARPVREASDNVIGRRWLNGLLDRSVRRRRGSILVVRARLRPGRCIAAAGNALSNNAGAVA